MVSNGSTKPHSLDEMGSHVSNDNRVDVAGGVLWNLGKWLPGERDESHMHRSTLATEDDSARCVAWQSPRDQFSAHVAFPTMLRDGAFQACQFQQAQTAA